MPTSSKNGPRSRGRTGARWEHTRRRVLNSSSICAICNEFVDQSLKWPEPMSPSVDHIVPISQLEWDSPLTWDATNARVTHLVCNQRRGNATAEKPKHPVSRDWLS